MLLMVFPDPGVYKMNSFIPLKQIMLAVNLSAD